jgi:NAD+ kinase
MLDEATAASLPHEPGCVIGEASALLDSCDILMPVGGDGTLIRAAHDAVHAEKPIIGVNTGRLGFLTQLEDGEVEGLTLLRDGNYTIQERMMLEGSVTAGDGGAGSFLALNDIVISRSQLEGIADMEVHGGGRLITRQRGDGMIFSTPTGSTGYSLSAGGPVADPELELILLTAICPHGTFRCSLALPADREYTAREHIVNRDGGLIVTADGRHIARISANEEIRIKRHGRKVRFIDLGMHDFFRRLGEKLSWQT